MTFFENFFFHVDSKSTIPFLYNSFSSFKCRYKLKSARRAPRSALLLYFLVLISRAAYFHALGVFQLASVMWMGLIIVNWLVAYGAVHMKKVCGSVCNFFLKSKKSVRTRVVFVLSV